MPPWVPRPGGSKNWQLCPVGPPKRAGYNDVRYCSSPLQGVMEHEVLPQVAGVVALSRQDADHPPTGSNRRTDSIAPQATTMTCAGCSVGVAASFRWHSAFARPAPSTMIRRTEVFVCSWQRPVPIAARKMMIRRVARADWATLHIPVLTGRPAVVGLPRARLWRCVQDDACGPELFGNQRIAVAQIERRKRIRARARRANGLSVSVPDTPRSASAAQCSTARDRHSQAASRCHSDTGSWGCGSRSAASGS